MTTNFLISKINDQFSLFIFTLLFSLNLYSAEGNYPLTTVKIPFEHLTNLKVEKVTIKNISELEDLLKELNINEASGNVKIFSDYDDTFASLIATASSSVKKYTIRHLTSPDFFRQGMSIMMKKIKKENPKLLDKETIIAKAKNEMEKYKEIKGKIENDSRFTEEYNLTEGDETAKAYQKLHDRFKENFKFLSGMAPQDEKITFIRMNIKGNKVDSSIYNSTEISPKVRKPKIQWMVNQSAQTIILIDNNIEHEISAEILESLKDVKNPESLKRIILVHYTYFEDHFLEGIETDSETFKQYQSSHLANGTKRLKVFELNNCSDSGSGSGSSSNSSSSSSSSSSDDDSE